MTAPGAAEPALIEPLALEGIAKAAPLFALYPYKAAQKRMQKLDGARLAALYQAQLRAAAEAGAPHWLARRGAMPLALAGLAPDAFHSGIYGIRMGKLQPWLNTEAPELGPELLERALAAARGLGYEHLSVRLDGEDFANLHLFEAAGFRVVDLSLKFTRPMPLAPPPPGSGASDLRVRIAEPGDAEWMKRLGSRAHERNHFCNDPALPIDKTRALFEAWVARCIGGLAYRIYALEGAGGAGRGFVIYLRNAAFAKAVGPAPIILDYVVLDPAMRGAGAGPRLIAESLAREADSGFDFCELRTSQHNHAAIACYEKLGFRVCATDFILHGPAR